MRMVRTTKWKLVRHYLTLELNELYDLTSDPGEAKNLYYDARHVDTKKALQERLSAWQRAMADPLLARLAQEPDPAKR